MLAIWGKITTQRNYFQSIVKINYLYLKIKWHLYQKTVCELRDKEKNKEIYRNYSAKV
jgi:hypothetical protein